MSRRNYTPKPAPEIPAWSNLMNEALTAPGRMSSVYSRFYDYSVMNQLLLLSQGVFEPVATYQRWQDMGRQVVKGSTAKFILRPIQVKVEDRENPGETKTITKFKAVRCLFGVSETEGEDLPEYEPPEWNADRALGALAINRVAFKDLSGNMQGYSIDRDIAINPVAGYPFKTLIHEVSHVEHGHTTPDGLKMYQAHRGLMEFQAEGAAYIVMNDLAVPDDQWDKEGSRHYIQTWLRGEKPSDAAIKDVFKVATRVLKAGREVVEKSVDIAS